MPKARDEKEVKDAEGTTATETKAGEQGADTTVNNAEVETLKAQLEESNKAKDDAETKLGEAEANLKTVTEERDALKKDLETKDAIIGDQTKQITDLEKVANAPQTTTTAQDVVEVAKTKEQLVKVKFLKAHDFSFGMKDIKAVKGDVKEVDLFIANKLTARGIAITIN